jgi:cation-transporting ATPase 13A1
VIPLIQVFARTSPEQKELVLRSLRSAGWTTLMVGDGTNDVGGLKAAHVGVALLAPTHLAEKIRKARAAADKKKAGKSAVKALPAGGGVAAERDGVGGQKGAIVERKSGGGGAKGGKSKGKGGEGVTLVV